MRAPPVRPVDPEVDTIRFVYPDHESRPSVAFDSYLQSVLTRQRLDTLQAEAFGLAEIDVVGDGDLEAVAHAGGAYCDAALVPRGKACLIAW